MTKIGLLDISVCVVVVVVLLLPARALEVSPAYIETPELVRKLGAQQLAFYMQPSDGRRAELFGDQLAELKQNDWALSVAGVAASYRDSPFRWRALRALSTSHIIRMWVLGVSELNAAFDAATQALSACISPTAQCSPDDKLRLKTDLDWLGRGKKCGDPSKAAKKFQKCVGAPLPRAKFLMGRGSVPNNK